MTNELHSVKSDKQLYMSFAPNIPTRKSFLMVDRLPTVKCSHFNVCPEPAVEKRKHCNWQPQM